MRQGRVIVFGFAAGNGLICGIGLMFGAGLTVCIHGWPICVNGLLVLRLNVPPFVPFKAFLTLMSSAFDLIASMAASETALPRARAAESGTLAGVACELMGAAAKNVATTPGTIQSAFLMRFTIDLQAFDLSFRSNLLIRGSRMNPDLHEYSRFPGLPARPVCGPDRCGHVGSSPASDVTNRTAKLEHQAAVKIEPKSIRIPIHPPGAPSPPRSIQNKLLMPISESLRASRKSVRHPGNAGLYRNLGGVVGVEPFHALAHALLLPVARDLGRDRAGIGERRAERRAAVLVRLAHHRGGALAPDLLVARERGRRIVEILREAGRDT